MKKKINIARIIWISCIYLLLIVILIMVMDYKINHEYESGQKIYFYQCDNELCITNVEDNSKELYSVYDCNYITCPTYKKVINDDYALLESSDGTYVLYNYKTGLKISENYDNYTFINNDYIIVNKNNLEGVIDIDNNITVNIEYDQIGYYKNDYLVGYNTSNIIAMKSDYYGIISYKDGKIIELFKYKEDEIDTLLDTINN